MLKQAPFAAPLVALLALAAPATAAASGPSACAFTALIDRAGIHQLSYEELQAAAAAEEPPVSLAPLRSGNLHLTHFGKTVPIWVADGGDGLFGPGDHIELLGEPPRGHRSTFDEAVRFSAYRLSACDVAPTGARRQAAKLPAVLPPESDLLRVKDHLEQDRLLLRFNQQGLAADPPELWYWAKLTQIDPAPFKLPIDLRSFMPNRGPLHLKLDLRGWSYGAGARVKQADHQLELSWNGEKIGTFESNGQERLRIELPPIPSEKVQRGLNFLTFRIPQRQGSDGHPIIDVLMLNWIELEFPRRRHLQDGQQHIALDERQETATLVFRTDEDGSLLFFDESGLRWDASSYKREKTADGVRYELAVPAGVRELHAVNETSKVDGLRRVAAVEVDLPSQLGAADNKADYLMIVHPSLRQTLEPLAELHRRRGLDVEVVDVRDIYEEFSHGQRRPEAIRDFIAHAVKTWQDPKPRWVLLVGDASWDSRNEQAADENYADWTYQPGELQQFVKNGSTPYADAGQKSRDLIPAWTWEMQQGHAASDNFYVSIEGDDILPDLAIGRLPIVDKAELRGIIAKIEKYVANLSSGEIHEWQKRTLFITNHEVHFQRASDRLATVLEAKGLTTTKVYPESSEPSNAASVEALKKAFNDGQLVVHFIGHGGRYIWRTGPDDLKRNNDLFTLDDLDKLTPTDGLPFVLSLTCYSAPFDHPTADSIGEKLLRIEDKGAIAVLAAAWRNVPSTTFSRKILEELRAGRTIGEAVMAGKRREGVDQDSIRQYNLLGDPALPIALPAAEEARPEWLRNRIRWQTASEVDNFGYDIYRGLKEEGPFEKITKTPIPGHGTTDEPSTYEYWDTEIEEGVEYWYYVESISIQGERERFTPIFKAKAKTKPEAPPEGKTAAP